MAENIRERIGAYRPTKTVWFWSTAAAVALTIILGFSTGGWVTGGAADARAEEAADDAVVAFAAKICAYRFLQAPDAGTRLAALKDEGVYERGTMLEDGGWVTFAGAEQPLRGAARQCADQLMQAEVKPVTTPAATEKTAEAVTPS